MTSSVLFSQQKQYPEIQPYIWSGKNIPFGEDHQKLIHSSSLRRLQAKTQVWGTGHNDFFRTRLTHTLETAQIAEQLAFLFDLPPHALRSCALAHDLGHPPFAHEGAHLIHQFCMKESDGQMGFDDNVQNIRVLTQLCQHPNNKTVKGLNLSAAVIDGLQKSRNMQAFAGYPHEREVAQWAQNCCGTSNTALHPFALSLELADDISYACHDFEDAIKAQMIPLHELTLSMLPNSTTGTSSQARTIILQSISDSLSPEPVRLKECQTHAHRIKDHLLRKIFHYIRTSLTPETLQKLQNPIPLCPSTGKIQHNQHPIYQNAPLVKDILSWLKAIVRSYVIDQTNVQRLRFAHINSLHQYLTTYWNCLKDPSHPLHQHALLSFPPRWRDKLSQNNAPLQRLRNLTDYVVGMSDDYFIHRAAQIENPQNVPAFEIWK
mgnify:CR=1 FL=1